MKKDFLSDVRLASVTLSDLRAHLVAKGVAESHIKLASTKFALVALAEEKDLDLEELLSKIDEKTVNERQQKQRRVDALGKELETMQVAVNKDSEKHQIEVVQVAAGKDTEKRQKKRKSSVSEKAAAAAAAAAAGAKELIAAATDAAEKGAKELQKRRSKGEKKGRPSARAISSPDQAGAAAKATMAAEPATAADGRENVIDVSDATVQVALSEWAAAPAPDEVATAPPPAAATVAAVAATGSASKASAVAVTPGLPIPAVRLSVRLDNGTVHYISLTVPRSAECG